MTSHPAVRQRLATVLTAAGLLLIGIHDLPAGHDNNGGTPPAPSACRPTAPSTNHSDSGESCRPHHYWIVSSRDCEQDAAHCTCCLKYFEVNCRRQPVPVQRQHFLKHLRPDIPVCIVIHGSFVGWDSMLHDSAETFRWLRQADSGPTQYVFFTWPSDNLPAIVVQVTVSLLGRRGARNGFYLAGMIEELPPSCPVSIIAHSHGARVALSALHLRGGGKVQDERLAFCPKPRRIRTVLAAAAVDHHWLNPGERYERALYQSEYLLNLANKRDLAIMIYPLRRIFGHRALAYSGLTKRDRKALGPISRRLSEWNIADLIGKAHTWPHFYDQPQLACRLAPLLFFRDLPPPPARPARPAQPAQPTAHPAAHSAGKPLGSDRGTPARPRHLRLSDQSAEDADSRRSRASRR